MELLEKDVVWLAAILDTSGSFLIAKRTFKGKLYDYTSYEPSLVVLSKSLALRQAIHHRWGGTLSEHRLTWGSQDEIRRLLTLCQPYLIAKQQHCRTMLEFLDSKREVPSGAHPTEGQRAVQEGLRNRLSELNQV